MKINVPIFAKFYAKKLKTFVLLFTEINEGKSNGKLHLFFIYYR